MVKDKKFIWVFCVVSFLVVFFDQISKQLILLFRPSWESGFLNIHFLTNTGAGFGIMQGQTWLLGIISLAVALAIIFSYNKFPQEIKGQALFALLLGGVVGNMIDRFLRGYVIDFIDLGWWPAFNIADAAISISAIGLIIYYWKE